MFNSKKIKKLSGRVAMLEMQLIALQNSVSPAKKRGRPAKKLFRAADGETKRRYVKSGKYAKVTTKKK